MPFTVPVIIAAALAALAGAIGIAVYSRRRSGKEARDNRIREFSEFMERFRSNILDPNRRPDFWVPYFQHKLPELRNRFDSVASGLAREKRRRLNDQIVSLVPFFHLPPAEVYEHEEEIKTLVERLNR